MNGFPHLTNAPIFEAIVDLRVSLPESATREKLLAVAKAQLSEYSKIEERHSFQGKVDLAGGGVQHIDLGVRGYNLRNREDSQVVQFRLDGFTFSRLRPYKNWQQFRDEAMRCWKIYQAEFTPEVSRVAVRYINRLDIPLPVTTLTTFFGSMPEAPAPDFQTASFLNRVELVNPATQVRALLTQAQLDPTSPNVSTFVVDIDVYKESPFNAQYEAAWKAIEEFRSLKNRLFYALVKEPAWRLYQ